jgi:glycosyltransferase involved in cell wall biosynthesis
VSAISQVRHEPAATLSEVVEASGTRRVDVVAWRDLDDPEAGGSELHAHEVLSRWAAAGVDVRLWTSRVDGLSRAVERAGYRSYRRAGRYAVFAATAFDALTRRLGNGDGIVEIWNGMPFFSPLWALGTPRITFLHHVHGEMWRMVLPERLARVGETIEQVVAPPFYRRGRIVTLSESSKREIVEQLGFRADRVSVAPPGIDPRFSPRGPKAPDPLLVTVGRLVPVKRFDWFIDAMAKLRAEHPQLQAVVVGEGYERPALEARVRAVGAGDWLTLPGRLCDADLLELYRRAWLVVSTSSHEGWGMTITEAGACGTPAVATRIAGHEDAVDDGRSGILVDTMEDVVTAAGSIISEGDLRQKMSNGAIEVARRYSWEQTALATFRALADQTHAQARRRD